MKAKILGFSIFAAAMMLIGADTVPLRLDVTGQPEGAYVSVDGQHRGKLQDSVPCVVLPLTPGRHLLHVEAPNYRPLDTYIYLNEATNWVSHAVDLEPERGIVLLKTKPAGAAVTYKGNEIGTTPLLITSLACGRQHSLKLALKGYQSKSIDLAVASRRPIVRNEELVFNSGIIACTTEPSGATVLVNGIERGVTPLEVMIPRGGAKLTIRLDGYKEIEQSVSVAPGERQTWERKLEGQPARLCVVTEPSHAKVYIDGNYQGNSSPVILKEVSTGTHEIRIECPGYATETETIQLQNGGDETKRFTLKREVGCIVVTTEPSGAKITLDGNPVGIATSPQSTASKGTFKIKDVAIGNHRVGVSLPKYHDDFRNVNVNANKTEPADFKMVFKPNFKVVLETGEIRYGILVESETTDQNIVIENGSGTQITYPKTMLRNWEWINPNK